MKHSCSKWCTCSSMNDLCLFYVNFCSTTKLMVHHTTSCRSTYRGVQVGWGQATPKQQEYLFTHVETNLIIDQPLYISYTCIYVYYVLLILCKLTVEPGAGDVRTRLLILCTCLSLYVYTFRRAVIGGQLVVSWWCTVSDERPIA